MRLTLLCALILLFSCDRESGNSPFPITNNPESPATPGGGDDQSGTDKPPVDNKDPDNGDDGDKDDDDIVVDTCPNDNATDPLISEHSLTVHYDDIAETYTINFAAAANKDLKVVSVYVNNEGDEVPTFLNQFKLTGKAYWMMSVDDPFGTHVNLPINYGSIDDPGVDVTTNYDGPLGGILLNDIEERSCLMFTIITFEEEKEPFFRTSTFYKSHKI